MYISFDRFLRTKIITTPIIATKTNRSAIAGTKYMPVTVVGVCGNISVVTIRIYYIDCYLNRQKVKTNHKLPTLRPQK